MKIKLIIATILIALLAILAFRFSQKKVAPDEVSEIRPIKITTQTVEASREFKKTISYPGIIASENQINLTANTTGVITQLNFELGKKVYKNQRLATIDSNGNIAAPGGNGLKNTQIQTLELAVLSAKENYKLAKDNYKKDDSYANKKAKEIAEINLLSAEASLRGALDGQFIVTPIAGTITQKNVSLGDSVSFGEIIGTVSQLENLKVQFFINKEELNYFKLGDNLKIKENNETINGKISKISPQAEETTKRFLIEAVPIDKKNLLTGSVVNIEIDINYQPSTKENIILPLSAITTGQNESYIFINQNNQAKKVSVIVEKVFGEMAEIKAEINNSDLVIIEGNKMVKENTPVTEKTN